MVVIDRCVTVPYDAAAGHTGGIGQVYVAEDAIAFLERVISQERAPRYGARARVVKAPTRIDRRVATDLGVIHCERPIVLDTPADRGG